MKFVVLSTLLFFLALFIIGPFISIWSLNTIFGLQIPMTFKTWVAFNWLVIVLQGIKIKFDHHADT